MEDKEIFEKIYEKPGAVWTSEKAPRELIELIEKKIIKPCKVIDIGCGEGFYSIYLASKGFDVLGIDLSEKAIEYAKENASRKGVNVRFIAMDISDLKQLDEKFDFVFEWAIMHHIPLKKRETYVKNITNLLTKKGSYVSVSFNLRNPYFGQQGKRVRVIPPGSQMPAGSKLYFSSLLDMENLFKSYFKIIESKRIFMQVGRKQIGNYLLMERS